MQLLQTVVQNADLGKLKVSFLCEGGETVEVTMAASPSGSTQAEAVAKAQAMMVQLAAVGERTLEGEAQESYTDRDRPTSLQDRHYRLEYREGEHVHHTPDVSFSTAEAARAEVERSAIDLVNKSARPLDATRWVVRAIDGDGNVVASITYDEARRLASASGSMAGRA